MTAYYSQTEFHQDGVVFIADNDLNLSDPNSPTDQETISHLTDALDICYDSDDQGKEINLNGMSPREFATLLVEKEEQMIAKGTTWNINTKFQQVSSETTEYSV